MNNFDSNRTTEDTEAETEKDKSKLVVSKPLTFGLKGSSKKVFTFPVESKSSNKDVTNNIEQMQKINENNVISKNNNIGLLVKASSESIYTNSPYNSSLNNSNNSSDMNSNTRSDEDSSNFDTLRKFQAKQLHEDFNYNSDNIKF
jgi:hypothetical protein